MKRLLALGLSAVMFFTLVACGNNKTEKTDARGNSAENIAENDENGKISME